jgi:hypothetical protein
MIAIATARPSVIPVWERIFRSGPGPLAALVDGVLTSRHRPPPPECDDHVLGDDPETQMMIALICAIQI